MSVQHEIYADDALCFCDAERRSHCVRYGCARTIFNLARFGNNVAGDTIENSSILVRAFVKFFRIVFFFLTDLVFLLFLFVLSKVSFLKFGCFGTSSHATIRVENIPRMSPNKLALF